jgi:hypothetical protein
MAVHTSVGVPSYRTTAGTPYVAFRMGERSVEGEAPSLLAEYGPQDALASRTLEAVRAYRAEVPGDVRLTWRIPPQEDERGIYLRLAFEPA